MWGYIEKYYPTSLDYRKHKSDDRYYKLFHINDHRIIYLTSCNSTRKKYNIDEYTDTDYKEDCVYTESYNINFRLSNSKYNDMINTMIFNLVKNTDGDKNKTSLGINFKFFQDYPILTYKMVESRGTKKSFWGKEKNVMIPRHITEEESNEIHNRYSAIGEELKELTESGVIKPAEPVKTKAELREAVAALLKAAESASEEPAALEPEKPAAVELEEPAELEPAALELEEPADQPTVGGKRRKRATKKRKTKGKKKTKRVIKRKTRR
jgi:hypothetical protein